MRTGDAFTYSMVKAGPDVSPDEVEVRTSPRLRSWSCGTRTSCTSRHLSPPRSFYVGEELATERDVRLLHPERDARDDARAARRVARLSASLVILPRSRGYVDIPGQGKVSLADLISSGRARPSSEMSGAHEFELPAGAKARMELEGSALVFQVGAVNAGKTRSGRGDLRLRAGRFSLHRPVVPPAHGHRRRRSRSSCRNMSGDDTEDDRSRSDPHDAEAPQRRGGARARGARRPRR